MMRAKNQSGIVAFYGLLLGREWKKVV
jgi:hypothetical protein